MKCLLILAAVFIYFLCSSSNGDYVVINSEPKNSKRLLLTPQHRTDLCGLKYTEIRSSIGEKFKIYHTGGVYSTINKTESYVWPSENIRSKSGLSGWGDYTTKAGDIGELVHVFRSKNKHSPYILLLKVDAVYVPISCGYVVKENEMDIKEESDAQWARDSLKNIEYANGCIFKYDGNNGGCWSRQSLTEIDRVSENFTCSLIDSGIDTVLLAKFLSGNGSSSHEHACIFWVNDGQNYFRRINVDKHLQIVPSSQTKTINSDVFSYFFENKIDTVLTDPTPMIHLSHEHGYLIQLFTPENFFCQKLTGTYIEGDPEHIKSIWWSLMISEIEENSLN